jgi:hypothetical protein
MDTPTTKKTWGKPKLMVLSRASSDESVLEHCKRIGPGTSSLPITENQSSCSKLADKNCGACQARAGS